MRKMRTRRGRTLPRVPWVIVSSGLTCLIVSALTVALVASANPAAVQADQTSDPSLLELAQRYIQRDGTGQIDLRPGEVPDDLPVALPLPAGNRLIGSVIRRISMRNTTWDVLFDILSTPDDVAVFYQGALQASGWTTPPPINYAGSYVPSGFQFQRVSSAPTRTPVPRTPTPNVQKSVTLCPSSGDPGMTVMARQIPSGMTGVTVHFDAYSTQCSYLRRGTPTPAPPPSLPALSGPPDAAISPVDYEEVGDNLSDATVETDLSATELEAIYSKQLEAAGWTRITGDARGSLAWSLWSTSSGKQGYLSVLEIAGQDIRDVHIQVGSVSS